MVISEQVAIEQAIACFPPLSIMIRVKSAEFVRSDHEEEA